MAPLPEVMLIQESHAIAGKPRDAALNSDRYPVCWHFAGAISAGVIGQFSVKYKSDLHVLPNILVSSIFGSTKDLLIYLLAYCTLLLLFVLCPMRHLAEAYEVYTVACCCHFILSQFIYLFS